MWYTQNRDTQRKWYGKLKEESQMVLENLIVRQMTVLDIAYLVKAIAIWN